MSAGTHPSLRMDVPIIILLIHLTHTEIRGLLFSRAETETGCSLGHFPCGNMTECLPQALQCNGHKDCPNGADERRCGDNVGWADLFGETLQNSNTVDQYFLNECFLQEYPESCDCIQTDVACVEVNLQEVPRLSPNITWLSLRSNQIRVLSDSVFSEYSALERLFLQNNSLQLISKDAFSGLHSLKRLFLSENLISSLSPGVFKDLHQLEWLDLEGNQIQTLNYSILKSCSKLEVLLLMDNQIRRVPENTFQSLWKLAELNLSTNRIKELPKNTFKNLSKSLLKL
ncbi:hypothetical protein E3U43_022896 [Larimichthys crocea]|uniref:Uncharacterized protein n=1 Tax=Larimichthys crocea TaxID=215358 RepID=A0ACD3R619_LARCR|nr:hypothetical protein E3U43_022896 [Larimichthys crocea]